MRWWVCYISEWFVRAHNKILSRSILGVRRFREWQGKTSSSAAGAETSCPSLARNRNGRDLLVVPEALQNEIIRKVHKNCHFAVEKTEKVLYQKFYIPKERNKIENVIANCVESILHNKKHGKGEGFLNPIPKANISLHTYHIAFIGPLLSINKRYQHILTVVDGFTKFTWFYPVKFPSAKGEMDQLNECTVFYPVFSKFSHDDPTRWFKHISNVQCVINTSTSRSTKYTPFELMMGTKMKNKEDVKVNEVLREEYLNHLMQERDEMRNDAKQNILKIQEENKRQYNKERKNPTLYKLNDLVAIQMTQYGTGLKLRATFYCPYKITTVKPNDRYDTVKIGCHDGHNKTSTAADHMKFNCSYILSFDDDVSQSRTPDQRMVEICGNAIFRVSVSAHACERGALYVGDL
ncbi:hypothetical protein AVEN_79829-1 [Araneus ventricosus]|uniref:RNA-directed DNA polymerase n=1 Tax=Araneus ventricosus TaxID=182803 RepID=A0A4Y2F1H4_ARAVE|nr:hypothetical protein AVEN_79829-1 [Araneus ventricosus]